MDQQENLVIVGMPDSAPAAVAAVCRSRLLTAVSELQSRTGLRDVSITVGTEAAIQQAWKPSAAGKANGSGGRDDDDLTVADRARRYESRQPLYAFEQLVLPPRVIDELLSAVEVVRAEKKVFDTWGLRAIEPFPRTALNFHGAPGTGKTLAAHALAAALGRRILIASYAEIESKFHGDGPKNVQAIFYAAQRDNALLFIDEADSLLSRRLTNVTQGSEQAINSMRSQLLICLEQFRGIVIFATNLVANYDKAFETRVRHIHFPLPDEAARREIWRKHLVPELPLAPDVSIARLAALTNGLCGRDIKNITIAAAVQAARHGNEQLAMREFETSIEQARAAKVELEAQRNGSDAPLSSEEMAEMSATVARALPTP